MTIERTFSIIKPDAVAKNAIGSIVAKFEAGGLRVVASRMVRLTETQAARSTRCTKSARSTTTWSRS